MNRLLRCDKSPPGTRSGDIINTRCFPKNDNPTLHTRQARPRARTDAGVRGVSCAFPDPEGSACLSDRPQARRVTEGQCPRRGYATSPKRVRDVLLHQTRSQKSLG